MNLRMTRSSVAFVVALLALFVALGGTALGSIGGAASNSATFTDPANDSGTAPDITSIEVSNDDAGRLSLRIDTPATATLPADARFYVFFDTDQDPLTGDPNTDGSEYVLVFDGATQTYDLARWEGAGYVHVPTPTATVGYASGLQASLSLSDLGSPAAGFNFWVRSAQGADVNAQGHYDDAPNDGSYTYTFAPAPPERIKGVFYQTRPLIPKAGKRFALTVLGLKVDPPEIVLPHPDTLACTAKLGGKRLAGLGAGGCTWALPKSARGKRLVVSVTLTYKGATATFPGLVVEKVSK